jgi:hypothetical protein
MKNEANNNEAPKRDALAVFVGSVLEHITLRKLGRWLFQGFWGFGLILIVNHWYIWLFYATKIQLDIPFVPTPVNLNGANYIDSGLFLIGLYVALNVLVRLIYAIKQAGSNVVEQGK